MKYLKVLSLTFLILLSTHISLQGQEIKPPKYKITGAYLMTGAQNARNMPGFSVNPLKLGMNESIQKFMANGTSAQRFFPLMQVNRAGSSGDFTMLLAGIEIHKEKRSGSNSILSQQFRVGFSYNDDNFRASSSTSWDEIISRTIVDTLVFLNAKDTTIIYSDSLIAYNTGIQYTNKVIHLDISWIFRLNEEKTFSLFGGIGISPGLIYNARTELRYHTSPPYSITRSMSQNNGTNYSVYSNVYGFSGGYGNTEFHTIRNKPGFACTVYIPVGLNIRLGKKSEFWKHLNFYMEFRPSLVLQNTPELGGFSQSMVGRYMGVRASF